MRYAVDFIETNHYTVYVDADHEEAARELAIDKLVLPDTTESPHYTDGELEINTVEPSDG